MRVAVVILGLDLSFLVYEICLGSTLIYKYIPSILQSFKSYIKSEGITKIFCKR